MGWMASVWIIVRQLAKSIHDFTSAQHPAPPRLSPHPAVPLLLFQLFNCFNLYHRLCEWIKEPFQENWWSSLNTKRPCFIIEDNHQICTNCVHIGAHRGEQQIDKRSRESYCLWRRGWNFESLFGNVKRKRVAYLVNCMTEVKNHLVSTT